MIDYVLIFQRIGEMFLSPVKMPELLWIMIPVYGNWITNDLLTDQTPDFVNFISGGFTSLWIGMTFGRELTREFSWRTVNVFYSVQSAIVVMLVVYGIVTIIAASKQKEVVKYISRTREITYVILWLVPIYFEIIPADMTTFLSALLLFPVFYIAVALIDRFVIKSSLG